MNVCLPDQCVVFLELNLVDVRLIDLMDASLKKLKEFSS